MRNILSIAGKELRSYFHSPIAYLVMSVYSLLCGFFFYNQTGYVASQMLRMSMMGGQGAPPVSLNDFIVRPLVEGILTIVLLLLLPLVTMRLYAEEKRSGTIELLLTSPLTDMQIILGKFLGALALFSVLLVLTFGYIGILFIYGNPNLRPVLCGALGLFLYGAGLLALGMWISTFTKNQIIAGTVSLVVFLLLYVLDWPQAFSTGTVAQVLAYMAFSRHLDNFAKGVIDLSDLVYYLSVITLGVFMTARSVDALKGSA
jgi:ABC-2 type transport system permease protein